MKENSPPKYLEKLMTLFQLHGESDHMLGNYAELYSEKIAAGKLKADLWYFSQVIRSIPVFIFDNLYWGAIMFLNFLKVAFRQLLKNKIYSAINLTGLSLGLISVIFMIRWVSNELSYDRYVEKGDQIYRILLNHEGSRNPMFHAGIVDYIRAHDDRIDICGYGRNTYQSIRHDNKNTFLEEITYADPSLLDYLDIEMKIGDPKTTLNDPYSIIISESAAQTLFGDENPVGEILEVNNTFTFVISGVFKDIPSTSHLDLTLLTSFETSRKMFPSRFERAGQATANFYTKIINNDMKKITNDIFLQWYIDHNFLETESEIKNSQIEFQPLYDIHLFSSDMVWDRVKTTDVYYVIGAIASGILILLLACFNFINLSTAKNLTRIRELGIRRAIGSGSSQLFLQYIGESALYVIISFLISVIAVLLLLPRFNEITGKVFTFGSFLETHLLFIVFSVLMFVVLILAILPIMAVRKISLVDMISYKAFSNRRNIKKGINISGKHILVTIQFVITVLICSILFVVNDQMEYMMNRNPGYNAENVILLENPYDDNMFDRYSTFANEARNIPGVKLITCSNNVPGENVWNYCSPYVTGKTEEDKHSVGIVFIQKGFFDVLGTKVLKGRTFFEDPDGEDFSSIIINESAAKLFEIEEPETKTLTGIWNLPGPHNVVGIVENLYTKSFYEEELPTIYMRMHFSATNILLKVEGNNIHNTFNRIKTAWDNTIPDWPIRYRFLDDDINNLFAKERTVLDLLKTFSFVAILISAMGIFGLISFTVIRKTKEIGIRKVLGASLANVTFSIMKEFIVLVLVAYAIAFPIAYYLSRAWLQNFAYSVSINFFIFILAGFLAMFVALISAGFKTLHAASLSPVKAIKEE